MAAATMPSLPVDNGLGTSALEKDDGLPQNLPLPQVHTPPTTDEASRPDDDAASSSSLSELGDDIEDDENRMRFEDAARAGAEAEQYSEVSPIDMKLEYPSSLLYARIIPCRPVLFRG